MLWVLGTIVFSLMVSTAVAQPSGESCSTFFRKLNPAERQIARQNLETQRLEFLTNPPTGPIRVLKPEEVSVTAMNDGKPFYYDFADDFNHHYYEGPKRAAGSVISFRGSRGQAHKIEIVSSNTGADLLSEITGRVLRLPADVLEATRKIEIQSFETGWNGLAHKSMFILSRGGLTDRTVRHEFGHNLAYYIWGRTRPFDEWTKVVKLDGDRFTTPYAEKNFSASGLTEDFADAVAMYLTDAAKFRDEFPNRASLLDTIFHASPNSPFTADGVWQPLRDDYHARRTLFARLNEAYPGAVASVSSGAILVGAAAGSIYYLRLKFAETEASPTPRPRPPADPH